MVIGANETGKCPHCGNSNRFETIDTSLSSDVSNIKFHKDNYYSETLKICRCTVETCRGPIVFLDGQMIWPLGTIRPKCPGEVPKSLTEDYNEACLVEPLSKKAAAALARRCLQNLLHEQGIKKRDLDKEIEEVMKQLPSYLSESIDAIRVIGNFAAHPTKFKQTGEIVEVEEGEAEWTLDVLEQLFDFYYVQPTITQSKKDALNLKLKEAGKPEMK